MEDRVADDLPQVEEVIIKEEARDWELEEQQLEDCLSISLESQQRSEDLKNSDEFKKEIQISTPLQGEVGTMDWMAGADGLPDKKPFRACPYCSQKVTCISQLQSHIAECHPGRKRA
ncbi:uncharacterized protein [Anabrus simplex]|uniref:uncharacterized protein n=1 Tax=Anabrus simplex TaxID=316456 RepID=UPI0035A2FCD7